MCAALGYMGASYGLQVNNVPAIEVSSESVILWENTNDLMVK